MSLFAWHVRALMKTDPLHGVFRYLVSRGRRICRTLRRFELSFPPDAKVFFAHGGSAPNVD